jgi:hypothetical protein
LQKVGKFEKQLKEIDGVTKYLQTLGLSLAEAREAIEQLIAAIESDKSNPSKALFQCKLGTNYIGLDSHHLVTDPHYISGIVKMQEECLSNLTEDEKESVSTFLLKGAGGVMVEDNSVDDDTEMTSSRRFMLENVNRERR